MQLALDIRPPQQNALGGGLEGAERTSRETALWSAPIISPDRQINPVKEDADARARDSVQNDGLTYAAVQTHKDSIVGGMYRLNAQPNWELLGAQEAWAEEFQATVEGIFNLLSESTDNWFDASRKLTFTDMIRLGIGAFAYTGEILATAEWVRQVGRPLHTAIQMVSPSRLSNPNGTSDTRLLRRGVLHDTFGEAVGYHIRKSHPTDYLFDPGAINEWSYIPARKPWGRRQVLHILEPMQVQQTRGIADMVSALKEMRMTKHFKEITLQNAIVNATYAAAVESELPSDVVFGAMGLGQAHGFKEVLGDYVTALENYVGGSKNIAIDGVKIPHLFPGTKLNLKTAGTPGGVGTDFEASLLRHTAAPLGLSYEEFSRDFTKTNYSSARASMGQTWKFIQGRKKSVADKYATMIYVLILEELINAKAVPLPPGFTIETWYTDPIKREALCACEWIGAPRGQIDEMKETQAALMRIKGGLSTWEAESAHLGKDWRRLFRQQSRERRYAKSLDLEFTLDATKPGANDAQSTMKEKASEDD